MKITILTDAASWLNPHLLSLTETWCKQGHNVTHAHQSLDITTGDVCFILSYSNILDDNTLQRHKHNLVVHESDLPRGTGWSPMTWSVLEGKSEICVTLFEATGKIDAGPIYKQLRYHLEGHELIDELRRKQAEATIALCDFWIQSYPEIVENSYPQSGERTYYPRRTPKDSELDPHQTLEEQFNLLRVVDNDLYPAFFRFNGQVYRLKIDKIDS